MPTNTNKRIASLDALRGLAILLMILDHILAVTGELQILRFTVTRFSMPLFFLVSGFLLYRVNIPRLVIVGLIGIALPMYVGFIDEPNVLFLYAVFAPFIVWARNSPLALMGISAFGLAMYANNFLDLPGAYAPFALFGLMALGKLVPRESWERVRLPRFLNYAGRYPLTTYVVHLLVLETFTRLGLP